MMCLEVADCGAVWPSVSKGISAAFAGLRKLSLAVPPVLDDLDFMGPLPSGIRHVGFDLRLGLRQGMVGIDIWFWRAASRPIWDRIRTAPEAYDTLIGANWNFEPVVEGRQRVRMFLDRPAEDLRNVDAPVPTYRAEASRRTGSKRRRVMSAPWISEMCTTPQGGKTCCGSS
jgi:hypothetical protein